MRCKVGEAYGYDRNRGHFIVVDITYDTATIEYQHSDHPSDLWIRSAISADWPNYNEYFTYLGEEESDRLWAKFTAWRLTSA